MGKVSKVLLQVQSVNELENTIANKIVYTLSITSLPNGLYLSKVVYPYLELAEVEGMCGRLWIGLR